MQAEIASACRCSGLNLSSVSSSPISVDFKGHESEPLRDSSIFTHGRLPLSRVTWVCSALVFYFAAGEGHDMMIDDR